ncbi:hypothetical protein AB0I60_27480 [Actinosynnema sp. NPDC050436]|uniref:hypothetical protein n=1 Tax=Actinosynnema sp. NPDC050436 TaxID=3155659 RepID=UPI003401D1DE
MTREVRAVAGDPVQTIRARDAAVVAMIDAVRAVGEDRIAGDRPTALWLADWRTLLDARAGYADDIAAGRDPEWVTPTVDGTLITDRMVSVGVECTVPPEISDPR